MAPFMGALLAIALFGEPITVTLLLAGVLMAIGLWLHLTEAHAHQHAHEALEHSHRHVHDNHHQHEHPPGIAYGEPHSHWHRHPPLVHRSEEHTSELQSLMRISYTVFCLKKKQQHTNHIK